MEKQQIVISRDTALALKNAGIGQPSFFSYYTTGDTMRLEQTENNGLPLVAAAYTATELLELLPGGLDIDENTWVAAERSWVHPTEDELSYPYAHLSIVKSLGGSYVVAYYHRSRNIAFRKTADGKAENLLFGEDNPAESLALMALALLEEGKLLF